MKTLQDGAIENLRYAIKGLEQSKITDYIIIGGWCPYLNRKDKYHPGTIDVDILFKEAYHAGFLEKDIKTMQELGYFTSAKHQFQLLNVFEINKARFCFNIDLLHTGSELHGDNLFVDQLDLNVLLSEEEYETIKMKSIVTREANILFDANLFETMDIYGAKAKIVNFTGMFITKLKSCQKEKRDRDSYDIYLGFINDMIDVNKLNSIANNNIIVSKQLSSFKEFISDSETRELFDNRVKKYDNKVKLNPSQLILEKLKSK